jgi:hypothetical protein
MSQQQRTYESEEDEKEKRRQEKRRKAREEQREHRRKEEEARSRSQLQVPLKSAMKTRPGGQKERSPSYNGDKAARNRERNVDLMTSSTELPKKGDKKKKKK